MEKLQFSAMPSNPNPHACLFISCRVYSKISGFIMHKLVKFDNNCVYLYILAFLHTIIQPSKQDKQKDFTITRRTYYE